MSKGNSEWDKVCQVARWGLQISFCSLALLFELFKVCSGEMRTISMTICTVSYKEEAFFSGRTSALLSCYSNICWEEEEKKKPTTGLDNIKKPDSINQFLSQVENVAVYMSCHVTGLSLHFLLGHFWLSPHFHLGTRKFALGCFDSLASVSLFSNGTMMWQCFN